MIRLGIAKPAEEAIHLELDACLRASEAVTKLNQQTPDEQIEAEGYAKQNLGKMARCGKWPPRDNEEVLTPSSAEVEAEGKETRSDTMSIDTNPDGTFSVRVTKKGPQAKPAE